MIERPEEGSAIPITHAFLERDRLAVHVRQQRQRRRRHEHQRQHQRSEHGADHGERHRLEHPAFHAFEREDRDVHRHDDRDAEQDRAAHLDRGITEERVAVRRASHVVPGVTLGLLEPVHEVLHHHDRAVHDQPEVERAKRHLVGGVAEEIHSAEGHQHRKRNHGRHDQ